VHIDVADTGPGLEAELMDQLFQPFVTRKKDGTGLGLWISRSMVERYGGDITAGQPQGSKPPAAHRPGSLAAWPPAPPRDAGVTPAPAA
jgi:nitrogen fixation/metabolism regulation signal transduction histidine kinase